MKSAPTKSTLKPNLKPIPKPTLKPNPRPPKAWWVHHWGSTAKSYPKRPRESLDGWKHRISTITGGIWQNLSQTTRDDLIKRYDNKEASARAIKVVKNVLNTTQVSKVSGIKYQSMPCPACGAETTVSRANVYLRCGKCGASLRSVRVKHRP